jgi:hypothetical protein
MCLFPVHELFRPSTCARMRVGVNGVTIGHAYCHPMVVLLCFCRKPCGSLSEHPSKARQRGEGHSDHQRPQGDSTVFHGRGPRVPLLRKSRGGYNRFPQLYRAVAPPQSGRRIHPGRGGGPIPKVCHGDVCQWMRAGALDRIPSIPASGAFPTVPHPSTWLVCETSAGGKGNDPRR